MQTSVWYQPVRDTVQSACRRRKEMKFPNGKQNAKEKRYFDVFNSEVFCFRWLSAPELRWSSLQRGRDRICAFRISLKLWLALFHELFNFAPNARRNSMPKCIIAVLFAPCNALIVFNRIQQCQLGGKNEKNIFSLFPLFLFKFTRWVCISQKTTRRKIREKKNGTHIYIN